MKEKKLIWNIIAFALLIPAFILPFINVFGRFLEAGDKTSYLEYYHLFGDYSGLETAAKLVNKNLQTAWMVMNSVFVTILMVLAVALLVLIVMDLCKFSFKGQALVQKIVAYAILVLGILAFVSCIIALGVNVFETTLPKTKFGLCSDFGMWFEVSFIVSGVFAILALDKKAKKAKK